MYLEYLWSNRMKWILNKKEKGCLFCNIAKEKEKSYVLKKGEFFVIMNKFPYNTGHLLVFPKKHLRSLEDLKEDEIKEIFNLVKKCIILLRKALKPKGFNVGINIGKIASASIPHFHIHIVPRFENDAGFMETTSSTKVMPESLHSTYEKLKKFLKILE